MYKIYLNISSRDKFLPLLTAKIIFDDLRNFSLSGRGESEKPSVEQNNDCFLKWLGRGIHRAGILGILLCLYMSINYVSPVCPPMGRHHGFLPGPFSKNTSSATW